MGERSPGEEVSEYFYVLSAILYSTDVSKTESLIPRKVFETYNNESVLGEILLFFTVPKRYTIRALSDYYYHFYRLGALLQTLLQTHLFLPLTVVSVFPVS